MELAGQIIYVSEDLLLLLLSVKVTKWMASVGFPLDSALGID